MRSLRLEVVDVRRVGAFRLDVVERDGVLRDVVVDRDDGFRELVVDRDDVVREVVEVEVLRELVDRVDVGLVVDVRLVVVGVLDDRVDVDRVAAVRSAPLSGPRISVHVRSTIADTESAKPTVRPLDDRAVPISSANRTRYDAIFRLDDSRLMSWLRSSRRAAATGSLPRDDHASMTVSSDALSSPSSNQPAVARSPSPSGGRTATTVTSRRAARSATCSEPST